jgi:hypothetical protein
MPEITQEEFDLLQQYKALGDVDQLNSVVASKTQADFERAASAAGYKPNVLKKLINSLPESHRFVLDAETNQGRIMTPEGEVDIKDFASQEWSDFLPSLTANEVQKTGIPYIAQSSESRESGSKNKGKKIAQNYIMQRYGAVLNTESVN